MDSILSFFIGQDLQDFLDFFVYNFPEESYKIQSPSEKGYHFSYTKNIIVAESGCWFFGFFPKSKKDTAGRLETGNLT